MSFAAGVLLSACGGGGGGDAPAPAPALGVSPTAIEISATVGEEPAEGEFTVRNSGGGMLSFRVSTTTDNLTLSPASGTLPAGDSAAVRVSYSCESEGTHNPSVEVTGGQQTTTVSVTAECQPASPPPDDFEYFDHPPLPEGAAVATPWHMTNVAVYLVGVENDFESFCTTLRIEGETPDNVNLYISPFNGSLNGLTYYAGIQTRIDGDTTSGAFVRKGRGAIFSRWRERNTNAIMRATGGLTESSGHEGDFISVRNDFAWDEGRYRLCLVKSEQIEGEPLPANYTAEDIAFAWDKYVHTWVRMEATDLDSGQTTFVGALAVPGTTLALPRHNLLFSEIYGQPNPFRVERVPNITIIVEQFSINGRALPYSRVSATSNRIPSGREDTPKVTRVRYDDTEGEIRIEQGRFTGRFGEFRTDVDPSRPAVESASLVSIDGEGYILALRDGQSIDQDALPPENLNFRADPVDADQVASMRLELSGPVSMSQLTNDAPYRLSGSTEGLSLPLGDYRFTATPYAQADGQGEQGASFDAEFTVAAAAQNAAFRNPRLLTHIEAILDKPLAGSNLARELGNLRRLVVAEGGVSDLEGLQYAKNLRVLELPGNSIEDIAALSGLGRLTELDLSGNRIRDIAPLRGRTELRHLDMRNNAIADIEPLADLGALQVLDISENQVRDLAPLAGLIALRELNANGNAIVDLTALAGLTRLRHLAVSRNRIADLATLAGLQNLKSLKANGNGIAWLDPLITLRALERLELNANRINDVAPLANLSELSLLRIRHNRIADFSALFALIDGDLKIIGMSDQLRTD